MKLCLDKVDIAIAFGSSVALPCLSRFVVAVIDTPGSPLPELINVTIYLLWIVYILAKAKSKLDSTIDTSNKNLLQVTQRLERKINHLKNQLADCDSTIASLETQLASSDSTIASLETQLASSDNQLGSSRARNITLDRQKKEHEIKYGLLEQQFAQLNKQFTHVLEEKKRAESRVTKLEDQRKFFMSFLTPIRNLQLAPSQKCLCACFLVRSLPTSSEGGAACWRGGSLPPKS
ncbi:hypothetical protein C8J56DRAFT_288512 [Mycena floridula]|nr:hypothetical protein C8J56DRAFT_288512 [Mycena floridula]